MKKVLFLIIPLSAFALLFLTITQLVNGAAMATITNPDSDQIGIVINPYENGRIQTGYQALFGPDICTEYGDPYSPFVSTFRPPGTPAGPYFYQYRIRIPADYANDHDILRVEIFDPDSHNSAINTATITRTDTAVSEGLAATASLSCSDIDQKNNCHIDTSEDSLIGTNNLTLDDLNTLWFMRVDENRGTTIIGACGKPPSYDPSFNTQTQFNLYYYASGIGNRVYLASYTGTTDNSHDTDLRWVSPGADVIGGNMSYDQVSEVPAVASNHDSFEINICNCPDTDVANIIVEPDTGDRFIYLEVATIDGASENGFELWAGPSTYTSTIASNANIRNLQLINDPTAHRSEGIEIVAMDYLPQNIAYSDRHDIPLLEIGPEYAGQTLHVTTFDSDTGLTTPLNFHFDSVSRTDWEWTGGTLGGTDTDGVLASDRCFPNCNNGFIVPTYNITVPGNLDNCDWSSPNPNDCTPFYGGRLMASYDSSAGDSYGWRTTGYALPSYDPTLGCSAFPIIAYQNIRSLQPPGTGSANDYPDATDFSNDSPAPTYSGFPFNTPAVALEDAQEGYIYKLQMDGGGGNSGWATWNSSIAANNNTLDNSLTWPGDSLDYIDHGDAGSPLPGFTHVVRGYVNPIDSTDTSLQIDDWVKGNTGNVNSSAIRDNLTDHIMQERYLRVVTYNNATGTGSSLRYQAAGFAIFKLQGFQLSNLGGRWLLAEFIQWDDSCGQSPISPDAVAITGDMNGLINTIYPFTATISPTRITMPITYSWKATGQTPVTQSNSIEDLISLSWAISGTKVITVRANNGVGVSTAVHTITVTSNPTAVGLQSFTGYQNSQWVAASIAAILIGFVLFLSRHRIRQRGIGYTRNR